MKNKKEWKTKHRPEAVAGEVRHYEPMHAVTSNVGVAMHRHRGPRERDKPVSAGSSLLVALAAPVAVPRRSVAAAPTAPPQAAALAARAAAAAAAAVAWPAARVAAGPWLRFSGFSCARS